MRMSMIVVAMATLAGGARVSQAQDNTLAILPLTVVDVARAKVEPLGDAFATASSEAFKMRVLGPAEARELLGPGQQKAVNQCDNLFCWARLGGAISANHVLAIKVTGAGQNLLVSLVWVDVLEKRVKLRLQLPIRDDLLAYLGDVKAVMAQVRGKLPEEFHGAAVSGSVAASATLPTAAPAPAPTPAKPSAASPGAPSSPAGPGWMGMSYRPVDEATAAEAGLERKLGVAVSKVAAGGPAGKGGLRSGDILLKLDGLIISSNDDLARLLKRKKAGETVQFLVRRERKERTIAVTLGEAPAKGER